MMRAQPSIALVLPVVARDRDHLEALLARLHGSAASEIVVAVPDEEWGAFDALRARHAEATWAHAPRGRGAQMNAGAAATSSDWLVFLHVDCRLSDGWETVLSEASHDARVVGGSYRFSLDSPQWRARLIEAGVRFRVTILGLPYGDQALFVRRDAFEALGGYRDWPLMEDLDLVRRLKRVGRLLHASLPVVTSARRWERDGWLRRSVSNVCLAALYFSGVSPARLALHYDRGGSSTTDGAHRLPSVMDGPEGFCQDVSRSA